MLEDESRTVRVVRVREHPVNYLAHVVTGESLSKYLLGPDPSIEALRAEIEADLVATGQDSVYDRTLHIIILRAEKGLHNNHSSYPCR